MANSDFPWFKFYARDVLGDERWQLMPAIARGVYIQLLAYQWENGSLPEGVDALARLAGLSPVDCCDGTTEFELFNRSVWPYLEEFFPIVSRGLEGPLLTLGKGQRRRNEKLESQRSEIADEESAQQESGRRGGLETQRRKRLEKSKAGQGAFKDPSRVPSRSLERPFKHPDADEDEDPLTPKHGGSEIPAGAPGSRADGTNPRAVRAAAEASETDYEKYHRAKLMRALDPGGMIAGTYFGNLGFRLWSALSLKELEQCKFLTDESAPSEISKIAAAARAHREARDAEKKRNGGTENGTVLIEAIPETNAQIRVIRGKA